jgi:hypothetical protein
MKISTREKMLALIVAMEQLTLEMRAELEEDQENVPSAQTERVPSAGERVPSADRPIRRGQRVRITMYRYRGRVGTIVDRRGTHYWDITLDATDRSSALLIYKKASSFVVID